MMCADVAIFDDLSTEQREALRDIVADWISEGFTGPPYDDAQYDIFEALDLAADDPHGYDTRRPELT
jgi:hypothetical protein